MSDTTLNGGSVRILWDASSSAVVNIAGNGNPSFTVNGSAVTFPYTLNSSTTFDTIHTGDYTVSVQHNGIEVAETPDGTKNVRLSGGGQVIFNPTADAGGRGKNLLDEIAGTFAAKAKVRTSRMDPFIPRLPFTVTSDVPTISYTDHTTGVPSGYGTLVAPTDPRLTFHGYVAGTRSISGNATSINVANGYLTSKDYAVGTEFGVTAPYFIEFDHYGLGVLLDTVGLQTGYNWQVFVDGKPVSATPLQMPNANTGASFGQYAKILFGAARVRRIRILVPSNIGLRGIRLSSANDAISPAPKTAPSVMILGDSWTAGTGVDTTASYPFPITFGLTTGWEVYACGQSGTGYVNQNSGAQSEFGSAARLNALADAQPDYLMVAGSSNDDGLSGVGTAAAALYSAVATRSPGTKIIVVGPQNTSATVAGTRETVRAAIIAAAQAAPNVALVIDPITDQWITGTGTVSAPGTAGNASVFVGGTTGSDGAHLNKDGYDYWVRRIVTKLGALTA